MSNYFDTALRFAFGEVSFCLQEQEELEKLTMVFIKLKDIEKIALRYFSNIILDLDQKEQDLDLLKGKNIDPDCIELANIDYDFLESIEKNIDSPELVISDRFRKSIMCLISKCLIEKENLEWDFIPELVPAFLKHV